MRDTRPRLLLSACVAGVLMAAPGRAVAQTTDQPIQDRVTVTFRLRGTARNGFTGAVSAATTATLAVGERQVVGAYGDMDGAVGAGARPMSGTAAHEWKVAIRVKAVYGNRVEFDAEWERRSRPGPSSPPPAGRLSLTLPFEQNHVLDLVPSRDPASRFVNLVADLAVTRADDESAPESFEHDIWLVRERRDGTRETAHESHGQFKGRRIDVGFSEGYGLDGARAVDQKTAPVEVRVSAALAVRTRAAGQLEISVDTEALLICGKSQSGGSGKKYFSAADGEVVAVEVPLWTLGACTVPSSRAGASTLGPGATRVPEGVRIASREFFGQDKLLLQFATRRVK